MTNQLNSRTSGILGELNSKTIGRKRGDLLGDRANHAIVASMNIITMIEENYTEEEAAILVKHFVNSIRTRDATKFKKALKRTEK